MYQSSLDNPAVYKAPLQPPAGAPMPELPTALMMSPGGRLATISNEKHNTRQLRTVPEQTEIVGDTPPRIRPQVNPPETAISSHRPSESLEIMEDDTTANNASSRGGTSWALRFPWFRKKRLRKQENKTMGAKRDTEMAYNYKKDGSIISEEAVYYGGLMKTASPSSMSVEANSAVAKEDGRLPNLGDAKPYHQQPHHDPLPEQAANRQKQLRSSHKSNNNKNQKHSKEKQHHLLQQHTPPPPPPPATTYHWLANGNNVLPVNTNKVFRNRSWISTSSKGSSQRRRHPHSASDEDSLADFDETEWTPQDSSYGAAIPICGWIPKRLRQFIEATLIVFGVFALVYLVVTTSIALSEHKSSKDVDYDKNDTSGSSSGITYDSSLAVDDDWYIEYKNDGNYGYNNGNRNGDDDDDYVNNRRRNGNYRYNYNNGYN